MASCPLCRQRKGRRACPAKGEAICSSCCGEKRRVEIACPDDCVYLSGSHAGAWEGRETERHRDARRLAPFIDRLSEDQGRIFLVALFGVTSLRARHSSLDDRLLLEAVAALRKTVETRERGVLYDHRPDDLRAEGLLADLRGLFSAKDASGQVAAPADADLAPVLLALEGAIAACRKEQGGGHVFLETAARVAAHLGVTSGGAARPGLIVEP